MSSSSSRYSVSHKIQLCITSNFRECYIFLNLTFVDRQQAKKEETFLRAQMTDNSQEPKEFVDGRSLHWANYAHGPYGSNNPNSNVTPYDPRNPDKDTYAHGRMHPNDYGPRQHIYESPNFT